MSFYKAEELEAGQPIFYDHEPHLILSRKGISVRKDQVAVVSMITGIVKKLPKKMTLQTYDLGTWQTARRLV